MLKRILFALKKEDQAKKELLEAVGQFGALEMVWCSEKEDHLGTLGEALLVTDYEDCALPQEFLNLPRLGYGLDYSGSAHYVAERLDTLDKIYLDTVYSRFYQLPLTITETKRLLIREMCIDDLDSLYAVYETLKDCPYIEQLYERREEEEFTAQYIKNMYGFFGHGLWLVIRKEDCQVIGRAGIENREINGNPEKELGYLIGKPWQQQGYAKEACQAILAYAKELELCDTLFLCSHKQNIPSIHLAETLGFGIFAEDIDGMNLYQKRW